jgi:hypothetical protein
VRVRVLVVVALALTGCADAGAFECETAANCAAAASGGVCEASGYCSFPDAACPSGRRYGSHAPAELASTCVPADVADDTSASDPTAVESGSADSIADDGGDTTSLGGDTTHAIDDSSSGGESSVTLTTLEDSTTDMSSDEGGSSTTGTAPFEVEYAAVIGVCTQDTVFDPTVCAAQAGLDQFTVDGTDTDALTANGWLRFDLDDALAGAEVTSATLVFAAGPETSDGSLNPGELWTCAPFDLADLSAANPMLLELVGSDFDPILLNTEVSWPVPSDIVVAGESLHLALVPTTTDGLDIWDASSATPPRLVITAE